MDTNDTPEHLKLYENAAYFTGSRSCSGYGNYADCRGVLDRYSDMLNEKFTPESVLDVGAAYGFVVDYFRQRNVAAWGIEPSSVALGYVPGRIRNFVTQGALPDLDAADPGTIHPGWHGLYQLVTCTEVLEHVPAELVPASLQALAKRVDDGGYFIGLIMLDGPGADGDEGHICLRSRAWWEHELAMTGLELAPEIEDWFNEHPFSRHMLWSTRFFVRRKPNA